MTPRKASTPRTAYDSCKASLPRNVVSRQFLNPDVTRPSYGRCATTAACIEAFFNYHIFSVASTFTKTFWSLIRPALQTST